MSAAPRAKLAPAWCARIRSRAGHRRGRLAHTLSGLISMRALQTLQATVGECIGGHGRVAALCPERSPGQAFRATPARTQNRAASPVTSAGGSGRQRGMWTSPGRPDRSRRRTAGCPLASACAPGRRRCGCRPSRPPGPPRACCHRWREPARGSCRAPGHWQRGHDLPGVLGVRDERQHRDQQQPGRLAEVDQAPGGVVVEDLLRLAQVGLDDRRGRVPGQQRLAVRDGDRVNIGVDHPGVRAGPLDDLVDVPLVGMPEPISRNWRTPGPGDEPHRPAEEVPVGAGDRPDAGIGRHQRPAEVLIGQEVVAATQQVVIDPGDIRPPDVNSAGTKPGSSAITPPDNTRARAVRPCPTESPVRITDAT